MLNTISPTVDEFYKLLSGECVRKLEIENITLMSSEELRVSSKFLGTFGDNSEIDGLDIHFQKTLLSKLDKLKIKRIESNGDFTVCKLLIGYKFFPQHHTHLALVNKSWFYMFRQ